MKDKIILALLRVMLAIRWGYFHVSPRYKKFYMDSARTEAHFQHMWTGHIHSNYTLPPKKSY